MVQAARTPQPPSPAGGSQGSTTGSVKSMWAALVLGILTAIFAWLWFGRVGEEKRSDAPEKQQTLVEEEDQSNTTEKGEETCACSNVDPQQNAARSRLEEPTAQPTVESQPKGARSRLEEPTAQPTVESQPKGARSRLIEPTSRPTVESQPKGARSRLEEPTAQPTVECLPKAAKGRLEEPTTQPTVASQPKGARNGLEESNIHLTEESPQKGAESGAEEPSAQPIAAHQEDGDGLEEPYPELQQEDVGRRLEGTIEPQRLDPPKEGNVEEPSGALVVEHLQEERSTQAHQRRLEESSTQFNIPHDQEGARIWSEEPNIPLPLTQDALRCGLVEPTLSQDAELQQEGVGVSVEEPSPPLPVEKKNETLEEGDQKVGLHPEDIQGESNGEGKILKINQTLSHEEEKEHKDQVGQEPIAEVTNQCLPESQILNISTPRWDALCENGPEVTNEEHVCEQKGLEGIISDVLANSMPVKSTSAALVEGFDVESVMVKTGDSSKTSEGLTMIEKMDAGNSVENIDVPEVDKRVDLPLSFNGEESLDLQVSNVTDEVLQVNPPEADLKLPDADNTKLKKVAAVQPMPQNVNVCFKVHYITSDSQLIAVTGDHEKLGFWEAYIPLASDKDGFWTHSVPLPIDSSVEWKFVMVENGKIKRWEECNNRKLKTGHDDINAHQWWGYL